MKTHTKIMIFILILCSNMLSAQIHKSLYVPTPCMATLVLEEKAVETQLDFEISPNPNKGTFTVRFLHEKVAGNIYVRLLNNLGNIVYEKLLRIDDDKFTIDYGQFSQGLYLIRIKKGDIAVTRKLIITY